MTQRRSVLLEAALRRRPLVRFTRPFEEGTVVGTVAAVGPQWFVLASVSGDIRFNGFGCCRIGRVLHVDRRRVRLLEITPEATWEEKPGDVRLAEITRVDFGGDYEDALCAVGGEPPGP